MVRALVLGFLIGFPIAASPGPIFFLVLRRSLARGWRRGVISGLGVATGDATYAALAAFGVAAVTHVLLAERRWIGLVGGIGLIAIGLRTVVSPGPHPDAPPRAGEGKSARFTSTYLSTVALTLSNPPTILSFAAVFAALGSRVSSGWPSAIALVLGVTIGSTLWWVVLTAIVAAVRERLTPQVTRAIALISGLALVAFGVLISLQSL